MHAGCVICELGTEFLYVTIYIKHIIKKKQDLVRSPSGDSNPRGADWLQVSKSSEAAIP
jgi:hypothetical protein